MGNATAAFRGADFQDGKGGSGMAEYEDAAFEWEDLDSSRGVSKIENADDDLVRNLQAAFDRDAEEEAKANVEAESRKLE